MKDEWRQGSLGKLKRGLPELVRERLVGAGAEEKEPREYEQWRFVLEEDPVVRPSSSTRLELASAAGRGAAADSVENLVLKIIHEDEIERGTDEPVFPPRRGPKWYAVAEPIRGVFDSYENCLKALSGKAVCGKGPVAVSSQEEGWAILNGGIRLTQGRYAFTDASIRECVGVAAVIVEMARDKDEPAVLLEIAANASEFVEKKEVTGVSSGELIDAFRRLKHIFGEMLALYVALQEQERYPKVPKLTVVHDYLGVSAWTCAAAPQGAVDILPGFTDAAARAKTWSPPEDETVMKVVQAWLQLATEMNLVLEFRHQPRGRSEAAGVNHFARFNRRADELAFCASSCEATRSCPSS